MKDINHLDENQLDQVNGGINWITFSKGIVNSIDTENPGKYAEYLELIKKGQYIQSAAIALQFISDGDPLFIEMYRELSSKEQKIY